MCGKTFPQTFIPKRIVVIQMELTEKQKEEEQRIELQKDIQRRSVFEEMKKEKSKEMNHLERWCRLQCS